MSARTGGRSGDDDASRTLGVVAHEIAEPFFTPIVEAIEAEARARGMTVRVEQAGWDATREVEHLRSFRDDGIVRAIVVGTRSGSTSSLNALRDEARAFQQAGGRLVFASQGEIDSDSVTILDRPVVRELATRLVDLGYREFAFVGGPAGLRTSTDRLEGLRDGLADRGIALDPKRVFRGAFGREGGRDAGTQLVAWREAHGPRGVHAIHCVFAAFDIMALGAIDAIREAGLDVPGDIAVAGFHGIAEADELEPPLTTVRVPLASLGREAVRLADRDADAPIERVTVAGEILLRGTTPPRLPPTA